MHLKTQKVSFSFCAVCDNELLKCEAIKTKNPAKGGFNPKIFGDDVYIALIIIMGLIFLSRMRISVFQYAKLEYMADLSNDYKRIEVESSPNTKAYCWTVGNEQNHPLFLVPGFTGTHTDMMRLAELLSAKYFVIVPDMPGWGESPRFAEKLTIENYTAYVKSLFDQLGISQITYVGHCMGATIGIEFTNQFPENIKQLFLITTPYLSGTFYNKLLVFDTGLALRFPRKVRPLFYLWRNRFFGAAANVFIIKVTGKMRKLKLIMHYVLIQGEPNEDSIEETWSSMIHYDYKRLTNVKSPVHIIHGNEDILTTKSQMKKLHEFLPSATVNFVLHAGHMPPIENPQGVAEAILKY